MSDATDRPQDADRPHRRTRGAPAPETLELLERYRQAMSDELGDVLIELRPNMAQLTLGGGAERVRPPLAERLRLWDLAIKLGRELAGAPTEGGLPPAIPPPGASSGSRSRSSAPHLSARARRELGSASA
jgi:hypothetical protein